MIINDLKLWVDLGSVVMEIFLLAYLMHILLVLHKIIIVMQFL